MKNKQVITGCMMIALAAGLMLATIRQAEAQPLKVFILAGQSNMEGHANISTFDYIGDDPATAPMLKMMRGADGKPAVCDGAWISYLTGEKNFVLNGKLTAGYGSMWGQDPSKPGDKIGPEFTFGLIMDAAFDEPVLIIKAAWGGKSLHTDFRPPSAGSFEMPARTKELWDQHPQGAHGIPKLEERDAWWQGVRDRTGVYYRLMIDHVKQVLADPKQVIPGYDASQGYELAGFAWLQGWNDMVDGSVYPNHNQPDRYALYSELLAHFIRDVRKDLAAPNLPFVIGVMGVGGVKNESPEMTGFRKAMAAPAEMLGFKGNVAAVQTAPFWSDELGAIEEKYGKLNQMRWFLDSKHKNHPNADGHMTDKEKNEYIRKAEADLISLAEVALWKRGASNAGYHYLGCAKTFALMGKAFAEANLKMLESQRSRITSAAEIQQGEIGGYAFGPAESVPEEFNAGFSLYAAAWPIVATYPGHRFQTGLCGTWMHPQYEAGKEPAGKCYTDIEGGLGWWRDTHFPTTTPKFIMGGVGPNFKFADQPAMLNADLTPEEREVVQRRVEMLHRAWTKDRNYLAPPDVGTLASLDPALILTPPRGMEAGYVPIARRQELAGAASHPNDQEKARQ